MNLKSQVLSYCKFISRFAHFHSHYHHLARFAHSSYAMPTFNDTMGCLDDCVSSTVFFVSSSFIFLFLKIPKVCLICVFNRNFPKIAMKRRRR